MTAALEEIAGLLAVCIGTAALIAGALALAVTHRPSLALSVFLDLLLAAGLLRLVGDPGWQAIVTVASIVVLRRLIGVGLRVGGRAWSSSGGGSGTRVGPLRSSAVARLVRPAWRS
ncbi:DUF1622 domain-containing protein [Blastococcus mobilis]|uniref:DUF1622 domain-containing protein n=1 Tax=Blastococcus mobilis TaxID=1938746 RepID=A0A238XSA5_9ACTN|nr:DUF1622 domain-containing protein [Blastococcus mobilis]SNR61391.1 Protein of unknown function [Blastococcus mobilis]